jgi:alpha-L-fucosidase
MMPPAPDRPLPQWYDDAKFGIFVHWTAASVPAFAPVGPDPFTLAREHDWAYSLAHSPYVEWYQNSLSIDGSPVQRHHHEHYGDLAYDAFVDRFLDGLAGWDPEPWADLFAAAGARYVVLVTKHHDGVLLWPSDHPNPHRPTWRADRDVVGELAAAVRARGLRFGVYYSGGLDWTFGGLPMDSIEAMLAAIPKSEEYRAYCEAHWHELIARYQPSVLWNDIASPPALDLGALFDRYFAAVPDGIVNDRFDLLGVHQGTTHADVLTPEYSTDAPPGRKWETCRGIGTSFGFNRAETPEDHPGADELIDLLVDVVGRGGNLLLNVGPNADGTIPAEQASRLLSIGWWLRRNGDAVHGTRPLPGAEGRPVRWTTDGRAAYAVVDGAPATEAIDLPGTAIADGAVVEQVGRPQPLLWSAGDAGVRVTLPFVPAPEPALALRVHPDDAVSFTT